MGQALRGYRVLDLTRVLAGPYSTMILADMGAEVIKIEIPGRGDDSRQFGPHVKGESAYFMSLNRNKKSMTLNLKEEKAKEIFKNLVKESDVVVENFRPGTMEKLGLGYEELKKIKPEIIYAACSGFGHSGPYMKKAAYDAVIQAMGGIMSITGQNGGKPTRVGASIADIIAGMFTSIGILTSLNKRERTGEGEKVDVAMLDSIVAILENAIARYVVTGEVPTPLGNRHPSITPFESFETSDGEIMIAVGNDILWEKFCNCIERQDLLEREDFKTVDLRTKNQSEIFQILSQELKKDTTENWLKNLDEKGIPCSPINTVDKVIENPQVKARNMIVDSEHPVVGNLKIPGIPIKLQNSPGEIKKHAPVLGEDTEEVLQEILKMKNEEIEELKVNKVI